MADVPSFSALFVPTCTRTAPPVTCPAFSATSSIFAPGLKETGRDDTGRKETGGNMMEAKEAGAKETGRKETGRRTRVLLAKPFR
ncbi:hypothetical protein LSAT2_027555 [Lamellibrachia satsuma]|nr:hypothetical protein LSAT2_027555 [Lamellibrachia satsuma]